jgi:hypothetical protein
MICIYRVAEGNITDGLLLVYICDFWHHYNNDYNHCSR